MEQRNLTLALPYSSVPLWPFPAISHLFNFFEHASSFEEPRFNGLFSTARVISCTRGLLEPLLVDFELELEVLFPEMYFPAVLFEAPKAASL